MTPEQKDRINELHSILTAISIDTEEVITEATIIINSWMLDTRYVKGYCRT